MVVTTIATILAAATEYGPILTLLSVGSTVADLPFCGKWQRRLTDGVQAWLSPDQVQFWKEGEVLQVVFEEIDTNATPTADLGVYVKVRRLRPALDRTEEEKHFFLTS